MPKPGSASAVFCSADRGKWCSSSMTLRSCAKSAGTVAGSSYGVAKKARVVGVRVLDNSGSGTTEQVVAGIDWVTANAVKPAVANMSLGGGVDTALDTAVRNSIASGITYAVAAGNDSSNASNYSPARVAEAITVGSTTSSDARSSFSNYGALIDIDGGLTKTI